MATKKLTNKSTNDEIIAAIMESAEGENGILTTALAKKLASAVNRSDIRVLFSSYHDAQELRKAFGNKVFAVRKQEFEMAKKLYEVIKAQEGNEIILSKLSAKKVEKLLDDVVNAKTAEITAFYTDIAKKNEKIESLILTVLDALTLRFPIGQWMRSVPGVGPVTTAAIISYLDIHNAPCANHFWSHAGLNPAQKWEKGQKRPYNDHLKTVLYNLGEAFIKKAGSPYDVYGKVFRKRRDYEMDKNLAGDYSEYAIKCLKSRNIKDQAQKNEYLAGRLPVPHIMSRARRYCVKMFLAHVWEVWYQIEFGKLPPLPYALEHLGHVHKFNAPYWDPKTRRILPPPEMPKGVRANLTALSEALNRVPSIGEFERYMEEMGTPVIPVPPISVDKLIEDATKEDIQRKRDSMNRIIDVFRTATKDKLRHIDAAVAIVERDFWAKDVNQEDIEHESAHDYIHRRRGNTDIHEIYNDFDEDSCY